MKKFNLISLVGQIIEPIFIWLSLTDLLIAIYYFLLNFLNRNFPKQTNFKLLFPSDKVFMKPEYDITVFLATEMLLIFSLWLYMKVKDFKLIQKIKQAKIAPYMQLLLLVPLFLYFVFRLGGYPLSEGQLINNYYAFPYLLVITSLLIFFTWLFLIVGKNGPLTNFLITLIILAIAIITFVAKFPIYYFDYSFFSGPILEIARGKTIYSQIGSQYSLLFVLILGYLAKFSLFDIAYLPVLVWLFYIVQYFLCFYLIYKIGNSVLLALLGLFSIITLNYFSLIVLAINLPQVGPVRWLPLVLSIYCLYQFQNIRSKKFILALAFLSFFVVDSGIYLVMAYLTTLAIITIKERISPVELIKYIWRLLIFSVGIFLAINLINLVFGYRIINIFYALDKINQYARLGFYMLPIPDTSYVWLIVAAYIFSIIYYFLQAKTTFIDDVVIYSAQLSAFVSIYYFGRSHPNNLLNISLFFVLNVSLLVGVILKNKSVAWSKPAVLLIFYLLLIVVPIYARGQAISANIKQQLDRLSLKDILIPDMMQVLAKYDYDVKLINTYIPGKNALIIFNEDTYLFYLTKKDNLMNMDPQLMISTQDESDFGLSNVYKICPKRLAADCKLFNRCGGPQSNVDSYLVQRLSAIESKCRLKYYPLICGSQICIGQAK